MTTIHSSFLPQLDAEASLAFWRDALGFEVRSDVQNGYGRWIGLGAPGQDTSITLEPPAMDQTLTESERATIQELIAKGSYARIILATDDLDGLFDRLQATGAEVIQEPTSQPWGVRDCAFRDPAGTHVRINEVAIARP